MTKLAGYFRCLSVVASVIPKCMNMALAMILPPISPGIISTAFRLSSVSHWCCDDLLMLDDRICEMNKTIKQLAKDNEDCVRLEQLRGIGPMTSTTMIATVGDARQYHKSRQMAAGIGITPRQHSSGDKHRLLGISKRGDVYLRMLMIHGARSVVARAKHKDDPLSRWVTEIAKRRHPNVAAVAFANKNARMAWAILRNKTDYDPDFAIR